MEWFKVQSVDELKELGKFRAVTASIKDCVGGNVKISGRGWDSLYESIQDFKQTLNQFSQLSDCYFTSQASEYIFYLTELDGQLRMTKLGITQAHFGNKKKAKSWRDQLSKTIHPDVCAHVKSGEAMAQLNDLYNQMVGGN